MAQEDRGGPLTTAQVQEMIRQATAQQVPQPAPAVTPPQPVVLMNAGSHGGQQLRPWGHSVHLLLSLFSGGLWIPFWVFMFLSRNKNVFY